MNNFQYFSIVFFLLFNKAIDITNSKLISRAAQVKKFSILPRDFSIATGELGPTLKLRRPIVHKIYETLINDIYKQE